MKLTVRASGLLPDLAFSNAAPLDVTKDFFPFGETPKVGDAFFIGSEEVFAKPDATVRLSVKVFSAYVGLGILERPRRVDATPSGEHQRWHEELHPEWHDLPVASAEYKTNTSQWGERILVPRAPCSWSLPGCATRG